MALCVLGIGIPRSAPLTVNNKPEELILCMHPRMSSNCSIDQVARVIGEVRYESFVYLGPTELAPKHYVLKLTLNNNHPQAVVSPVTCVSRRSGLGAVTNCSIRCDLGQFDCLEKPDFSSESFPMPARYP